MATIHDIAQMANVSTSTVSHVVNKTRYVSPELVERVEKAIKELEYLPNFVAKKTKSIAVSISEKYILYLVSDKNSNFQYQVGKQLEEELKDTEYTLITLSCNENIASLKEFFNHMIKESIISGIVAFLDPGKFIEQNLLLGHQIPMIILGDECKAFHSDVVISDILEGAYKAVRHLIQNGHEHIAFIGGRKENQMKMLQGYQKAFNEYQIKALEEFIFTNLLDEAAIFGALEQLLSGYQMPTAIFAANFTVVMPILKYMNSHNIICPDDISIISFSDFEWAPFLNPPITTVEQRTAEFAGQAVHKLLERLKYNQPANSPLLKDQYDTILLSTKLTIRDSTCGIGRGPFGEKAEPASVLSLNDEQIKEIRSKNLTAAISFHYAGKAWMELHLNGIKEVFDNLNISLIATTDAHFDPALQSRQLDSLRTLEPDIIIAIPTDNQATAEAFLRITKSKSRLVFISNVPMGLTPDDYITCVSVNERSHGRNMGHGLGEYMLHHNLSQLAMVTHDANFYATRQRDSAAEQVIMEEYPELKICGKVLFKSEDEIHDKVIKFMKRFPNTEAFYVSWDGPASSVMAALTELNRTDIVLVTGDLDYAGALNMAKGGMIKMISAQCPYEQGQAIATAAGCAMLNEKAPSFIGIEPISVTPSNLLKSWQRVFKTMPSEELRKAFLDHPDYMFSKTL